MKDKFLYFLILGLIFLNIIPGLGYANSSNMPSERQLPRLVDDAGLLDEDDYRKLLNNLDEISERQGLDVVVITIDSLEGSSAMDYADYVFDYAGYGMGVSKDGILLLLSMEERDWWISTSGYGISAFTDAGIDHMSDKFLGDLSNENYYKAFTTYADMADDYISQAKTGEAYDIGNLPKKKLSAIWMPLSLIPGAILAFFITGSMKSKLKSVASQRMASSYISLGSSGIANVQDLFLYSQVTRTRRKEEDNSSKGGSKTHTSSSGRTHGGKGGKF